MKLLSSKIWATCTIFYDLKQQDLLKAIFLSQRKYYLQLVEDVGLLASKSSVLPMDPNNKLLVDQDDLLSDFTHYR